MLTLTCNCCSLAFQINLARFILIRFAGNKSHLQLVLSLEIHEGALMVTLTAGIVATAEVKIEGNNYWQPLQTSSADRIVLRVAGIRFRGSVSDCNNAMQRLFYQVNILSSLVTSLVHSMNYLSPFLSEYVVPRPGKLCSPLHKS